MNIKEIALILFVVAGICAAHAKSGEVSPALSLSLEVTDGLVTARLRNDSSESRPLIDGYQSINEDEMPGFFFEITTQNREQINYCGMLDQGHPVERIVAPGDSVYFKMDVWMLAGSHCLPPGRYYLRVVYLEHGTTRNLLRVESGQVPLDVHSSLPDSQSSTASPVGAPLVSYFG